MKTSSLFFIFLFCSLFSFKLVAQQQKSNPVTVKFENYSVEQDKLVKKQLVAYHILYTCIPAGIVMINLDANQTVEKLKADLTSGKTKIYFTTIDIKKEDAEESCASFRTTN